MKKANMDLRHGGIIAAMSIMIFISQLLPAQNSPWQLRIGYEQLWVNSTLTDGFAENEWIFRDGKNEYFAIRATSCYTPVFGIRLDLLKWLSVSYDFKMHYRRYYVIDTDPYHNKQNLFKLAYHGFIDDKFLGRTLVVRSSNFGIDFHHNISKNRKWELHFFFSFNVDNYENREQYHDTPVNYGGGGTYTDKKYHNKKTYFTVKGNFDINTDNRGAAPYVPSTNMALAVSRGLKNGQSLRLEIGFRNIRFLDNGFLLPKNAWELELTHRRYTINDDGTEHIFYKVDASHDFPLYIGGMYASISYMFRPFRSVKDNPDYDNMTFWDKVQQTFTGNH